MEDNGSCGCKDLKTKMTNLFCLSLKREYLNVPRKNFFLNVRFKLNAQF